MGKPIDPGYDEKDTMTLYLDNGDTVECLVEKIFTVDDRQYIALLPMNEDGSVDEDSQVYLYRFNDLGNDEIDLENILDDDEFEKVSDYFDELLDEDEFNELFDGM